jgi:hypothetical protein
MTDSLLSPGQFLEQYKKLPDLLEDDDVTEGMMFFGWLSRPEWQFVYALSFAMEGAGLAPPNARGLGDVMIAAMRYVQERGHRFRGVTVTEDGRVLRKRHGLLEPRNGLSLYLLQRGKVPDYVTHFGRAVFLAEHHYKDENLRDLLRAALADLESTLATIPEVPRDMRDAVQARAAKLKELASQAGIDLSSPTAVEGLLRMDSEVLTLEEELEEDDD